MIARAAGPLILGMLFALPAGAAAAENAGSVLGLSFHGNHRAYPLSLFSDPRVINDEIRQQEIAVFHDGELGISSAWFRLILGEPIEFSGDVSGGGVVEDLTTITRWDMVSGKAVGGNLAGMELVPIPLARTSWAEWFAAHPDTTVFSFGNP